MNELARLGISMDTKPLRDGKAALEALIPAANRAEQATERFTAAAAGITGATGGASAGIRSFAGAASGAATGTDRVSKAALGAGTAMRTVQAAAAGAAAPIGNLTGNLTRVRIATGEADAHIRAYRDSLAGLPAAANTASSSLARLGAAANDNINRLQSTPGNIAAQFQDIAVTAAADMSPLLIALQQGTQLASAFQGGLDGLLEAFRQLFGVTTILTIGIVALVAYLIQVVDWMQVAQGVTLVLADGLDVVAEVLREATVVVIGFGVAALVAFGPALYARVIALATSIGATLYGMIGRATVAMIVFASANPFGALVIAIGLVIGAMALLNERFGGIFTSILGIVKAVANAIIRFFATAFNLVLVAAETTVNGIISAFEGVAKFLGFDVSVGKVDFSGAKIDTSAGRDFVGDIGTFIGDTVSAGAGLLRGLDFSTGEDKKDKKGGAPASRGQTEAERQTEAYDKLIARAYQRTISLRDEAAALSMTGRAAELYLNRQGLLADALEQGIKLDDARRAGIERVAEAMTNAQIDLEIAKTTRAYNDQVQALEQQADLIGLTGLELEFAKVKQDLMNEAVSSGALEQAKLNGTLEEYLSLLDSRAATLSGQVQDNRNAEFTSKFTRDLEQQMVALERSRGEIGLTGAALTAYRIETDLLNQATRQNIELTPEYVESIRQQAQKLGEVTEEVQKQKQRYDDARTSLRGFFGDMVSGLRQGQSLWEVFGNAVLNVVNRIIDRLLDSGTDSLLGSINQVLSAIGGVSGGGGGVSGGGGGSNGRTKSGGNTKSGGGVKKFASGGVFTDNVYSTPTLFKFAKGGSFGMMGEAGPEAVMPLKRGSDGSLGVRVTATEPQRIVVRVVTDDERFDAYVDNRVDQKAPQVAQAGSIARGREDAFLRSRSLTR